MELVDWFASLTKEERGEFEKNMSDGLELEALFIRITGGLAIAAQEKQWSQMQREPVEKEKAMTPIIIMMQATILSAVFVADMSP